MRPITASDLMNPVVLTVRDDTTVRELAAFLIEHEIHGAPVEDREGRLVGVVSVVDIAAAASERGAFGRPPGFFHHGWGNTLSEQERRELRQEETDGDALLVRDIMTPEVYAVPEEATVHEVASRMLEGHHHRLLVTREDRAVGIVSTSDLLGLLLEEKE
ncbi:MAG TPA: CBS domain-containing protein [Thermoanaerobaculia bacterium]|nr:CBS domain-containing protein [Thermoanaerobaculia bacterium]